MGKHTQRKPGYLPKVAASAAPLALLLAAPVSALADPTLPIEGLPLDHQESGTLDHELHTTTDTAQGSLGLTRHDVLPAGGGGFSAVSDFRHAFSGTQDLADGGSLTAVKSANGTAAFSRSQRHDVRLGSPVRLLTGNEQHVTRSRSGSLDPAGARVGPETRLNGVGGSAENGVWLPYGVDALSQGSGQFDVGRALSFDAGHFTGDLRGGAGVHREAAQAVDAGPLGSVVVNSGQHGLGQFTGRLDHGSPALSGLPGLPGAPALPAVPGDFGQRHIAAGNLGPVSGLVSTTQSAGDTTASNTFRGNLSVDEVATAHSAFTTTSADGHLSQSQSIAATALGRPLTDDGWTVSAPPLMITPQ